jgi:carboxymethylenebutenolidase
MSMTQFSLQTADGPARAFTFQPEGAGPWPGVLFFMDGVAIRPTLFEMGERLAKAGYFVLMPDMFWRVGPYEPIKGDEVFNDEAKRKEFFTKFFGSTSPEKSAHDIDAAMKFLADDPRASKGKIGTNGYCMGVALALRAAAAYPDRVGAVAGFHGGNVVNDTPASPHLLAPKIKAKVLIAGADSDASFTRENEATLRQAFDAAGVKGEVTIYEGALHGYTMPDLAVYKRDAAERHWREMLALFDETLKAPAAA